MEPWSLNTLLLLFGCGIFGACLGALWSFILCGFLTLTGCLIVASGGSDFMLLQVGLGPIWGPHVGGFASGVIAATYAAGVKKNHPTGHAKDILSPLVDTSWDVLVIGGIFAVVGHALAQILPSIPIINQFDGLALSIFINFVIARLLFLKEMPWGDMESIRKYGYLGTNDYAISWVGWQSPPSRLIVVGLGMGILSGGLAMGFQNLLTPLVEKGSVSATAAFVAPLIMGWAFAAITLMILNFATGSIQKAPVTHAIAYCAALAFLFTGSLLVAAIAGVFAAFLQELCARMFYNHGNNHFDPPAVTVMFGSFILAMLFKPEFLNLASIFK
ncbi:MAG: hypothetical protein PHH28_16955 [Desulfuromonadaceae bacterium]|nr:hypothetical protein [Desulfuromonadaceae bacterium]